VNEKKLTFIKAAMGESAVIWAMRSANVHLKSHMFTCLVDQISHKNCKYFTIS